MLASVTHNTIRGDFNIGIGDIPSIAATSNSLTFLTSMMPTGMVLGETVDDLTNGANLPNADTISSIGTVGTTTVIGLAYGGTPGATDDFQFQSSAISFYADQNLLGKFVYTIRDNQIFAYPSNCIVVHAHTSTGIQGVEVTNNGCGDTNDFFDFYNSVGNGLPWVIADQNQVQTNHAFFHGESIINFKGTKNGFYIGPGNGSTHPLPLPQFGYMFDTVNLGVGSGSANGNLSAFYNNTISTYPNSPKLVMFLRTDDNHDFVGGNQAGSGMIAPLPEVYQLMINAANFHAAPDQEVATQKAITASGTISAGSTVVVATGTAENGYAPYPGMAIGDTTNPAAITQGCTVANVVGTLSSGVTLTLSSGCSVLSTINAGDSLALSEQVFDERDQWESAWWESGSQTLASGSGTIQLEPYAISTGLISYAGTLTVQDLSNPSAIAPGTTGTVNGTTGVVTLSTPTTGPIAQGQKPGDGDIINFQRVARNNTQVTLAAPKALLFTGATSYLIPDNYSDYEICFDGANTFNAYVPLAPRFGQRVRVKDCAGNAATYPIIVHGPINGSASQTISVARHMIDMDYEGPSINWYDGIPQ